MLPISSRTGSCLRVLTNRIAFASTLTNENVWENPWKHALPEKSKTYTKVVEARVDWTNIEQLMPIDVVPEIPQHKSYPTPSGWIPPSEKGKTLSYYIERKKDHLLPLYLERKRDLLNEKTLDFEYAELVVIRNIEGDVFACEADLRKYVEKETSNVIATHVDELKGRIKVKGVPRSIIESFCYSKGF